MKNRSAGSAVPAVVKEVLHCIRKIFLFRKGMETTAYAAESDIAFYSSMAGKCSDAFCVETELALSTATMLLERNVNAKIVFCDLVDSMFLNV